MIRSQHEIAGTYQLYAAAVDGSGATRLNSSLPAGDIVQTMAWSPSGERTGPMPPSTSSNLRKVSGAQAAGAFGVSQSPIWSPDGTRIVYLRYQNDPQTRRLYVSTVDGLTNNRVNATITTADVDIDSFPTWSADSTRIVFSDRIDDTLNTETLDIWVGTPDGSVPIMLNGSNDHEGQYHY